MTATAPVLADFIRFLPSGSPGTTAAVTVGAAVAPYFTPASYGGVFATGITPVWYSIIDITGGNVESALGSYNASGTVFTRGVANITSSNSNALINATASAQFMFTAIAQSLITPPMIGGLLNAAYGGL